MSLSTARKAQTSVEMLPFIGLALAFLLILTVLIAGRLISVQVQNEQNDLSVVTGNLHDEIRIAVTVSDGYDRNFTLPLRAGNKNYSLQIINEQTILATTDSYESSLVTFNVTGQPKVGENTIRKNDGTISLN